MKHPEMRDIAFELKGQALPVGYQFDLWNEMVRCLPWLVEEESVGILPMRGAHAGRQLLLTHRAKLSLRVPAARVADTTRLSGQQLELGTGALQVGAARERVLQPCTTLHAHLVEGVADENEFMREVAAELGVMNIDCGCICGKHGSIADASSKIDGYSLVLHDLTPEASLQLQYRGLGGNRRHGCGIFVQYKAIAGLD